MSAPASGDGAVIDLRSRRRKPGPAADPGAGVPPARARAPDPARARPRCGMPTAAGTPCRNYAGRSGSCRVHEPAADRVHERAPDGVHEPAPDGVHEPAPGEPGAGLPAEQVPGRGDASAAATEEALGEALAFLRRRLTGDYDVDVFGFDRELTETVLLPLARPLYRSYWRVRPANIDNVPAGASLIVANHAGTLPFDAIMTKVALFDDHPARLHLRELAADLALRVPVVGPLARKMGNTLAHDDDAVRLLHAGETVGVWPEGYKGVGKPYRDRYKLQRFGRGGFVELALRTGAPIVPVAIIGSEEIYPMIGNVRILARLLGFPYFPVTWQFPWLGPLGLLPLPTKWLIDFGEPIETGGYGPDAADDPMLVLELTDRVRDTIQQMLYRNLMGRRSVFFG